MREITGLEFEGVVAGGEAAGGAYIWLTLRVGGKNETLMIEKSRVGELVAGLSTAAALARNARLKTDPGETNGTGFDTAYTLDIADATVGASLDGKTAILDVRLMTKTGLMDIFLSARPEALVRLGAACRRAVVMLANRREREKAN